jgi:hypothetical protein
MQKAAIVILSDPGTEEAVGRVFNALAAAYDFQERGRDVTVLFQGTGTRWAGELVEEDHPAHELYEAVKGNIAGASNACSLVFGATDAVEANGFDLVSGNEVPGTPGLPSLAKLTADGYSVITF